MASDLRFHCVTDRTLPAITTRLLRSACAARGVAHIDVDARSFDFTTARPLGPGDLLYRPAVSIAAQRVEEFLYADGVASFHADRDALYFDTGAAPLLFERAGLTIPRTVPCLSSDRGRLRRAVEHLGGLPIVVKVGGGEGGIGVMRLDTWASLVSVLDLLHAQGRTPMLSSYVPDAMHWRAVVVGDRVVACYRNPVRGDDFRSCVTADPGDYFDHAEPAIAGPAIAATRRVAGHGAANPVKARVRARTGARENPAGCDRAAHVRMHVFCGLSSATAHVP